MLQFTQAAKDHIAKQVKAEAGNYLRIWIKRTGCSGYMYMPEVVVKQQEGDIEVAEFNGVKVFLEANSVDIIKDTEVDYVEKSFGFKQLVFNNPNATGLCGCGESFKLKDQE